MYAVVSCGGKQYRVEAGNELLVEKLGVEPGAAVRFDRVLLVGEGDDVTVGTPLLDGASVLGTVLRAERGPKIIIFKFKQKVKYRRRTGHRQDLVRVRIDEINANGKRSKADARVRTEQPKAASAASASAAPARSDAEAANAAKAPKAGPKAKAAPKSRASKADAATQAKPKRASRSRATASAEDATASDAKPKRAPRSRAANRDAEEK